MVQFIFGGDTGETPESLKRKRELAALLLAKNSRAPRNVGEGLNAIGNALVIRHLRKQAEKGEEAGRGRGSRLLQQLFQRDAEDQQAIPGTTAPAPAAAPAPRISGPSVKPPAPRPFTGNPQADTNIQGINRGGKQDFNAPPVQRNLSAAPTGASNTMGGIISSAAQKHSVDPQTLAGIAFLESGGDPSAKNPRSSAAGLFQFTSGTAKQFGLSNPLDPAQSADAAARLAKSNSNVLRNRLGREPSPGEIYLAHQQGAGGASALLANPNARAVDVVGRREVLDNGGNENMTAQQFAGLWTSRLDGQGPQNIIPAGSTTIAQNRAPANQLAEVGIVGEQQTDAAPNLPAQQPANVQPTPQSLQDVPTNSLIALTQHPDFQFLEPQAQKFVQDTLRQRQRLDFEKQKIQLEAQARRNDPLAQARLRQLQQQEELNRAKVGKIQTEQLEGQKAEQVRQSAKERTANVVIEDIDRALDIIEGPGLPSTGPVGGVLSNLPGTNAFDVSKLLDTVKANAGFDRLQQMREASKTGGALGQVSERELTFLQATIGNLEQSQSEEQFKRNLQRVREAYDIVINKGLDNVTPSQRSKSRSGRTKSGINFTIEE